MLVNSANECGLLTVIALSIDAKNALDFSTDSSLNLYSAINRPLRSSEGSIFEISELKVQINWHSNTSDSIPSAMFKIADTTSVLALSMLRSAM